MIEIIHNLTTESAGVGYGTRDAGHPKCHRTSIGVDAFMSSVFNE
jgi:hypothetical protein